MNVDSRIREARYELWTGYSGQKRLHVVTRDGLHAISTSDTEEEAKEIVSALNRFALLTAKPEPCEDEPTPQDKINDYYNNGYCHICDCGDEDGHEENCPMGQAEKEIEEIESRMHEIKEEITRLREENNQLRNAEDFRHAINVMCENTRKSATDTTGSFASQPEPCEDAQYSYASKQRTACAVCGERKHTPLRRDEMGGYVCLTCIDERLDDYDVSEKILDEIKKRDAHVKQIIMWAEGCIDEAHIPDFAELSHVIESCNAALHHNTDQFEHEWDALTKEEMWNEIQDIRCLVDADGTMSICSSIEAYATQVADKRAEELRVQLDRAMAALETAARESLSANGMRPEWWLSVLDMYQDRKALAATEPKP